MPLLTSTRRAGCLAVLAVACAAPAGAHAAAVGEQIDRGDGSAGASPWYGYSLPPTFGGPTDTAEPFTISDDGRWAFLTYPTSAKTRGLYRRDVLANTLRLVIDDVTPTGRTASGSAISVLTKRSLVPADTNATTDLYLVNPFTGAPTLATTAPGGAALGGVTMGAVTADGTAVVYSTAAGTDRRLLSSSTPTRLSTRALGTQAAGGSGAPGASAANFSRSGLSADGTRAVLSGSLIATPAGERTFAAAGDRIALSPNGALATRALANGKVGVVNLTTGEEWAVAPALPAGSGFLEVLSTADAGRALIGALVKRGSSYANAVGTLDLVTGTVAQTSPDFPADYPRVFSENDRYGIARDNGYLFATPAVPGATLPGGVDPASPNVYFRYREGCLKPNLFSQPGGRPLLEFTRALEQNRGYALAAYGLVVNVRQVSNNAIINRSVMLAWPSVATLNAVFSELRLESTAYFADGRRSAGVATVPAYVPYDCYGNNGI